MKKRLTIYGVLWAICLAIFNITVFITPNEICGVSKFDTSFWVSYIFVTITFVVQVICAFYALSIKNINKLFYNLPLISVSYVGVIAMLIFGTVFMAVPKLPEWIAIILCALVISVDIIAITKATITASVVSNLDTKIEEKTSFIKNLILDSQKVMTYAENDELRAYAKIVYEALLYSDPTTNDSFSDINSRIQRQFLAFSDAVKLKDGDLSKEISKELVRMIETRNQNCKASK